LKKELNILIDLELVKSKRIKQPIEFRDHTSNPAPLGLLGFGLTTFLLNVHNAGGYDMNTMVIGMGLVFGGIA
jgi:hypothetical protein